MKSDQEEIQYRQRFQFGNNWRRFHLFINSERLCKAEKSLLIMLEENNLHGKTFLDIGSGSGLFSLAAFRLGASVRSFDYDADSVQCTRDLKERYCSNSRNWLIEQGDVLDEDYLKSLGQFDIVYSWGVLHHTGNMWKALENIIPLCKSGSTLFISIYNKQRLMSRFWTWIKRTYNNHVFTRYLFVVFFSCYFILRGFLADLIERRNPFHRYVQESERTKRGMNIFIDWIDWIGGYPFETAKPEEIFNFYYQRGFTLIKMMTCVGGNSGINEFVFKKSLNGGDR
jgi:2-polyprenyl-3-methyl-5-hydroxy-6-metoxy-1,4-benzoquinol methylase